MTDERVKQRKKRASRFDWHALISQQLESEYLTRTVTRKIKDVVFKI